MDKCCQEPLQQLNQLAAAVAAVAAADRAASKSSVAKARPKVLDTRPKQNYFQQRLLCSVNIQLPSLTTRCYLLPDKSDSFAVIVPSSKDYTVVQEQSQHGMQLADGSMAVYLKGAASLPDFLTSRGWIRATFLQDCSHLWSTAQQLQLIEDEQLPEKLLARRCLFSPSQLLASQIGEIEAKLATQYLQQRQQQLTEQCDKHKHGQCSQPAADVPCLQQQQQQQHRHLLDSNISCSSISSGSSSCTACRTAPGSASSLDMPTVALHALDLGCGSGRDLCWLASRQQAVSLPACKQLAQQQQQQQCQQPPPQMQSSEDCFMKPQVQVTWRVTGVDNWIGALERVHDLAAAMQLDQQQVELVVASICSKSGDITLQQLPAHSSLHRAINASVVHAGTSANCSRTADVKMATAAVPQAAAKGHTAAVNHPSCSLNTAKFNPTAKYDLILCVRFLERALLPRLKSMLKPSGLVLYSTFVDGPGLRAFGRPSGAEHVLQPGELAECWLGPKQGFAVLRDDITLTGDGREVCMFAAQLCL